MKEIDRWKNENFNTNRKVQRYTHRDEKKEWQKDRKAQGERVIKRDKYKDRKTDK
jgi:hypothetical protein